MEQLNVVSQASREIYITLIADVFKYSGSYFISKL